MRTSVRSERGVEASIEDRIRKAAATLFAERGFHGTGMRLIAERAGVSIGALYHYFPSKEEIFLSVLREDYERYLGRARALLEEGLPVAEVLERVMAAHFEALAGAPGRACFIGRAWVGEAPALLPQVQALREEYASCIADLLHQAMERKEIRRGHPLFLAYALLGLAEAVTERALGDDPVAKEFRQLGPVELAHLVWHGLRREGKR